MAEVQYPGGPYAFHAHSGHPLLGLLVVLLLVAVVCAALFLVFRLAYRGPRHLTAGVSAPVHDQAIDSLRLRYARGEIGRDEFLRTSADLGAPAPPA
jgi:uncharacterized membrane protein